MDRQPQHWRSTSYPIDQFVPEENSQSQAGTSASAINSSPARGGPSVAGATRGKRKRLAKACDSCHKSKRRCDGTMPCANCDFAGKSCVYTDSSGRTVPAPFTRISPEGLGHRIPNPKASSTRTNRASVSPPQPPPTSPGQGPLWPNSRPPVPEPIPPYPHPPPTSPPPLAQSVTSYGVDVSTSGRDSRTDDEGDLRGRPRPRYSSDQSGPHIVRDPLPILTEPTWNFQRRDAPPLLPPLDPILTYELVNVFFSQIYPANLVLHRPTFLHNLSESQVPLYLLNSVFALAAPISSQPAARTSPAWHAGERFAQIARSILFNSHGELIVDRNLECAQALCFLQFHEVVMRRPQQSDGYMRLALRILMDLGVTTLDASLYNNPSATFTLSPEPRQLWLSRECHRRTLWLIYLIELLSAAFSQRPMSFHEQDLRLTLPIDESSFNLMITSGYSEFIHPPSDLVKPSFYSGEFGHLIRITTMYCRLMEQLVEKRKEYDRWRASADSNPSRPDTDPTRPDPLSQYETALQNWRAALPEHLRFNEANLLVHLAAVDMGVNTGSWSFAYMHAIAECTVLALHEWYQIEGNRQALKEHMDRQQRAFHNLTVILSDLGSRGRSNLMMATPLLAVSNNRSSQVGPQILAWFGEYERQWGISLSQLLSVEWRQKWCGSPITVDVPQPPITTSPRPDHSSVQYESQAFASSSLPSASHDRERHHNSFSQDEHILPSPRANHPSNSGVAAPVRHALIPDTVGGFGGAKDFPHHLPMTTRSRSQNSSPSSFHGPGLHSSMSSSTSTSGSSAQSPFTTYGFPTPPGVFPRRSSPVPSIRNSNSRNRGPPDKNGNGTDSMFVDRQRVGLPSGMPWLEDEMRHDDGRSRG